MRLTPILREIIDENFIISPEIGRKQLLLDFGNEAQTYSNFNAQSWKTSALENKVNLNCPSSLPYT